MLESPPERITTRMLLRYDSFRTFKQGNGGDLQTDAVPDDHSGARETPGTPEETIEAAYDSLTSALRSDLLDRILKNSPFFFERVIVDLLVAMGYGGSHRDAARHLGRAGDGGVDGVINEDTLGLDRVYVQAKRYAVGNTVGRPEVQAFVGSLVGLGAGKGVFVTTSTFSGHAQEFVRNLSQRVILIDGSRLTALMVEHNVGVRIQRTLEFKSLDENFFTEDE
jgi:restriction system protein